MEEVTQCFPGQKQMKKKTPFARVVVEFIPPEGRPYYSILWYDRELKISFIGYSSFNLGLVKRDLDRFFEIERGIPYEVIPIPGCGACKHKGKAAKCSCCRRNLHIKDCYEEAEHV